MFSRGLDVLVPEAGGDLAGEVGEALWLAPGRALGLTTRWCSDAMRCANATADHGMEIRESRCGAAPDWEFQAWERVGLDAWNELTFKQPPIFFDGRA